MPKISIIMPLYNSSEYLKESIESILNQTFSDWEFIIINEFGSDDGSREIVEQYAKVDKRFILLQNETRLGISESMNRGLAIAKGEYIARMDADDISLPQRFQKQLDFMNNSPEIVMCGVKVEIFGSNPFEWSLETDTERLATNILFYSPCVHPTIMIRKSFLDKFKITYNNEYRASEDFDIFARICEHGKIANLNEVLFRYRIMQNNATFKNNDIGLVIYNQVMHGQFKKLHLSFSEQEIKLLSPHYSMKGAKGKEVIQRLIQLDLLLKRILVANETLKIYNQNSLMYTLNKRYKEAYDSIAWTCSNVDFKKAEEIYNKSIFTKDKFYQSKYRGNTNISPDITVLLPTFNSEKYLIDTLWSILEQSFTNFEVFVLNEFGSNDNTTIIANMFNDSRIKVIQNTEKLGLAESLNLGIREARGKYLARMDADDLCDKNRFQIQYDFLEENEEYGIVGSWQHHFGLNADWVHKCSINAEDIAAELLYNCDLCHSTLMMRKEVFLENNLFYDNTYAAEDYELWTRAIRKFKIANIPQVLGEYRIGEDNITAQKAEQLSIESGNLVSKNLLYYFNITVKEEHVNLLSGWKNEFNKLSQSELKNALINEKRLIKQIWAANDKLKVFNSDSLLKTLNKRWRMVTNTWQEDGIVLELPELFDKVSYGHTQFTKLKQYRQMLTIKGLIKRCLARVYRPIKYRTIDIIQRQLWDMDGHLNDVDGHIYDYKEEVIKEIATKSNEVAETMFASLKSYIDETVVSSMDRWVEDVKQSVIKLVDENSKHNDQVQNELVSFEHKLLEKLEEQKENVYKMFNAIDSRIDIAEANFIEKLKQRDQKNDQRISSVIDKDLSACKKNIIDTIDERIWKAELNMDEKLKQQDKILEKLNRFYTDYSFSKKEIKVKTDDKIKIVFLFQIASFWPSWESVYNSCINDNRFEVTVILYDKIIGEVQQIKTARDFLINNNIKFIDYSNNILDYIQPQVLVIQTPYDEWHRPYELWSDNVKAKGIHIVYIPYGVEIGYTDESKKIQFDTQMISNCWRIYTLSDDMKECYRLNSSNSSAVRVTGHPKFDLLIRKDLYPLSKELSTIINKRRICLWKVHFPQQMQTADTVKVITPYLDEYINFAKYIGNLNDIYFIFMPHPKFMEMCRWIEGAEEKATSLMKILEGHSNVTIYTEDDYRPALLAADFIITDRSALMIEAGINNVPVMYVSNKDYKEPFSPSIQELVNSYVQGCTSSDMVEFIRMCMADIDINKEIRSKVFSRCVPYLDGKCSQRIVDDIVNSLSNEVIKEV